MVAQRINWPDVRAAIPAMIEAAADPSIDLDAVADAMAICGNWPDWQTKHMRADLRRLRQSLQCAQDWSIAEIDAFVDRMSNRFSLSPEHCDRVRAALRDQQRSIDL